MSLYLRNRLNIILRLVYFTFKTNIQGIGFVEIIKGYNHLVETLPRLQTYDGSTFFMLAKVKFPVWC